MSLKSPVTDKKMQSWYHIVIHVWVNPCTQNCVLFFCELILEGVLETSLDTWQIYQ